jgi:hypothetical protein
VNSDLRAIGDRDTIALLFDINTESFGVNNLFGLRLLVGILKEAHFIYLVGNNGLVSRLPVSRANLAVLVCKLECGNKADGFFDRATNVSIVDLHGA